MAIMPLALGSLASSGGSCGTGAPFSGAGWGLSAVAVSSAFLNGFHHEDMSVLSGKQMAEGVGFEPTRDLHPWQFSRLLVSTAHAPFLLNKRRPHFSI